MVNFRVVGMWRQGVTVGDCVRKPAGKAVAVGLGLSAGAVLGAAGCTDEEVKGSRSRPVSLVITPRNAGAGVPPENPIMVSADGGTLQNVTVRAGNRTVEGRITGDGRQWRSRWTLIPNTSYRVLATALGADGRTRTVSGAFTTRKVRRAVTASVEAPDRNETVGVGMPIILRFDRTITDRGAVERALEVRADRRVEGAWHWFRSEAGDSVVFRPRKYWPAHTRVRLIGHLNGVRAVKNGYATRDIDLRFRIGEAHRSVAGAKTHRMIVYRNGRRIRSFPISMGRGGITKYTTTNGNHLTMDKGNPVIMDSSTVGCPPGCPGYYRLVVHWSVRISNSGEYTHSAPWSVGSQGNANVSHGCINMSPSAARWFYNFSYRGDPYKVTGTDRELEPNNGWGYWQLSWRKWVEGSALKQSLSVGPDGSTPDHQQQPSAATPRRR